MTRRNWIFRFCSVLLVPAGLLAQRATSAVPASPQNQPTQKVLIHVGTNSPENWQAALKKANDLMHRAQNRTIHTSRSWRRAMASS